jgi:predicted TIM-barrel fold metal-dependent hydrolase
MENPVAEFEPEYDRRVAGLEPFDAGAWIGYPDRARRAYPDAASLLRGLRDRGIGRALVSHTMAMLHDPITGNEAMIRTLDELPGFSGVMTLIPGGTGEIDDMESYVSGCTEAGLRAARVFPKLHRFSLRVPTVPPLLALLEQHGIPLFIQIGQTSWDEIGPVAQRHPRLAILVEGVGHHEYLNIRSCLPWLEAAPNILVPTHNQFLCGGLELMVERLGVHRMIFSSNQPMDDPAAGLSLLALSDLPLATKRRIAHGNLETLLDAVGNGGYFA